ncbi:hypothetical protein BLNAU_3472 [Blattamonas nauphoetae]|uniref:Uncharacterized protein n=1 Tax=Blattamonas nauphoetae TaxID=2049346 RepID=A0ABQ9YD66_9EUKA|nr:hypothetical protein BLNAU_3472 [Blattamonas nauphoetae]
MKRRSRISRMTPTRFCGLSSDVGNSLIAGADEQILGWPPIVQKWSGMFFGLLEEDSAGVPAALRSRFAVAFVHRRSVDAVPSARDAAAGLHACRPKAGHHALDVVVAGKGEVQPEMTTLANVSMMQPNNPLLAWTEVVIAQQEVCLSGVSKCLFCRSIVVTEALYG